MLYISYTLALHAGSVLVILVDLHRRNCVTDLWSIHNEISIYHSFSQIFVILKNLAIKFRDTLYCYSNFGILKSIWHFRGLVHMILDSCFYIQSTLRQKIQMSCHVRVLTVWNQTRTIHLQSYHTTNIPLREGLCFSLCTDDIYNHRAWPSQ